MRRCALLLAVALGVRSFGEVFVHMAGSTLLFCSYNGVPPPAGPAHDLALIYEAGLRNARDICGGERYQDQGSNHRGHGSGVPSAADPHGRASRRASGPVDRLRARQPHRTAVVAEEVAAEFT